jgi:hypothetical protein
MNMMHENKNLIIIAVIILLYSLSISSLKADFYGELNLLGGYSDNEQIIDNSQSLKNAAGFEFFKKYSNSKGDYLTLDVQMRMLYDHNDEDHYTYQIHNFWAEYKPGLGKSFRFGHFQPFFGLEQEIDTHSSIFQTNAMMDIGMKHDWGIAWTGFSGKYDYKIAAQAGLGMGFPAWDNNYLFTGRISRDFTADINAGISLMKSRIVISDKMQFLPSPARLAASRRSRIGFDLKYQWSAFKYLSEISYGANEGQQVLFTFQQVNYQPFTLEAWEFYLQSHFNVKSFAGPYVYSTLIGLGSDYRISEELQIKTAVMVYLAQEEISDKQLFLQIYYFWEI